MAQRKKELLNGVNVKIQRAEELIAYLEIRAESFVEFNAYEVVGEVNLATGSETLLLKKGKKGAAELGCLVGDSIHSLRCALDYLACAVVRLDHPAAFCADSRVQFPIGKDTNDFESKLKRYLQVAGPKRAPVFKRLQPYNRGRGSSLYRIHALDIKDKHRLLILIGDIRISSSAVTLDQGPEDETVPVSDDDSPLRLTLSAGRNLRIPLKGIKLGIRSSTHVARYPEFKIKFKPTGYVAFGEPGSLNGKPVIGVLKDFVDVVKNVVNEFEPFFM